ncbi:hypothetical protein HPB48_014350 [Haemaphysalis longicornis]|uniref:G-protein coupled receptors family 1 profile domain-containing protein n=1 Tax=Haemaphysalis longicornis TaxID=44386 RepID=A0A9J6FTI2_HAELO|nr:hypothetical protein HPB48_014350 [Haemaphysalis longicornis]
MEHPERPGFYQCVTFGSFPSAAHEKAYNLLCLLPLYGVPLAVIVICYIRIFWEIRRNSSDGQGQAAEGIECSGGSAGRRKSCRPRLRRSDMRQILRARNRVLRMTIVIILAFFLCWTPYVTMVLWYQIDPSGAGDVNDYLQSSLFMFAVSNSCVNPLVYSSYTNSLKRILTQVCCWLRQIRGRCCPLYAKAPASFQRSQLGARPQAPKVLLVEPVDGNKQVRLLCSVPDRAGDDPEIRPSRQTACTGASIPIENGGVCSSLPWRRDITGQDSRIRSVNLRHSIGSDHQWWCSDQVRGVRKSQHSL